MVICGNCGERHLEVTTVKLCYAGEVSPCTWLIDTNQYTEDGEKIIVECRAASWANDRAWQCESGHEHVNAEARYAEGWDYASDEEEASVRAKYGYESRLPDGHIYVG